MRRRRGGATREPEGGGLEGGNETELDGARRSEREGEGCEREGEGWRGSGDSMVRLEAHAYSQHARTPRRSGMCR